MCLERANVLSRAYSFERTLSIHVLIFFSLSLSLSSSRYASINAGCLALALLQTPDWRPRFRFFHWSTALLGLCVCLAAIFLTNIIAAVVLILFTILLAVYIYFATQQDQWGSAMRGNVCGVCVCVKVVPSVRLRESPWPRERASIQERESLQERERPCQERERVRSRRVLSRAHRGVQYIDPCFFHPPSTPT